MGRKLSDLMGLGLFLIAIALFINSFDEQGIIKYLELIGSIIIIIVEGVFLWQTWIKWE